MSGYVTFWRGPKVECTADVRRPRGRTKRVVSFTTKTVARTPADSRCKDLFSGHPDQATLVPVLTVSASAIKEEYFVKRVSENCIRRRFISCEA